jgi:hypothetical protein
MPERPRPLSSACIARNSLRGRPPSRGLDDRAARTCNSKVYRYIYSRHKERNNFRCAYITCNDINREITSRSYRGQIIPTLQHILQIQNVKFHTVHECPPLLHLRRGVRGQPRRESLSIPSLHENSSRTRELAHQAFAGCHVRKDTARGHALEHVLAVPSNKMAVINDVLLVFLQLRK